MFMLDGITVMPPDLSCVALHNSVCGGTVMDHTIMSSIM